MSGKQLSNVSLDSRSGMDNMYCSSKKHWCSSSKLKVMAVVLVIIRDDLDVRKVVWEAQARS